MHPNASSETVDEQPTLSRRQFVVTTAATTTVLAVGATGTAAAAEYNYLSEYAPRPTLSGSVAIAEHDGVEMSSALEYVADDGTIADLRDEGWYFADREDDEPHTPVRYRPDKLDCEEYTAFPRGEYRETGDDDEDEPMSWTDVDEWTGDVTATSAASGGDALELAGVDASATFDTFEIDSGVRRKYVQAVIHVDAVDGDDVTLDVIATDAGAAESVSVTVDLEDTTTYVVQQQIGDLEGAGALDVIDELTLEIDGEATVTIAALNLDRESAWSFGRTEVLEEDDDGDETLETKTVREPVGYVELIDPDDGDPLSTVDDRLVETVRDLEADVTLDVSGLEADAVEIEFSDASRHTPDRRMSLVTNFEAPTAYDLTWSDDLDLEDTVAHPGERHRTVEFATGKDEFVKLEAIDDDDVDLDGDRTLDYQGADVGDELTLSTTIDAGEIVAVYYEILVTDDEEADLTDTSAVIGPTDDESRGGILGTFMGLILTVLGALGVRSWLSRVR